MSRFEELDKLVKDGMMDKEAADDIKEKIIKKALEEKNIIMPTMLSRIKKSTRKSRKNE